MNQKPGISRTAVELLNMLANAVVVGAALFAGAAVIMGVLWAFYQLMVVMESLT